MSVEIQTVEFERRSAHLSSEEDEPPFTVHGVALGAGDVTVGQSGIKKLWPSEELERAAETLESKNLVEDHENSSRGVVGEVTKVGYKDSVGIIYEAELFDGDLADKISNGLLEVSIRGHHASVEELDEDDETEAKIVEDITFENLSIVPTGAAPSNTIEMGEAEELSLAELAAFTDELQEDFEPEAGDYVQWGDNQGIVLTMPDNGEVEVDLYEDDDGTFRPVDETKMVSVDELNEWDVDEDNIGAMEDDEEDEESDEEEDDDEEDEEENATHDEYIFETEEEARDFIEDKDDLTGVHEMDEGWMPGESHDEFMEWLDSEETSGEPNYGRFSPKESDDNDSEEAQQSEDRIEGEEEPIDSDAEKKEARKQAPERYPDDVDELQETEVHTPDFSGTTDSDWSKPALEDFGDDPDLSDVADHFIVSVTGFPPENYGDLALPVVEPNGNLNLNALQNAKARAGQVDGLSGDDLDRAESIINTLANENFDTDFEEAAVAKRRRTIDDTGDEPGVQNVGPVGVALDLVSKYLTIEGNHERDSVDNVLSWLFGNTDLPTETVQDFRVAANTFINQTADTDSFDVMTVEQFTDWLLMHEQKEPTPQESRDPRVRDKRQTRDGLSQSTTPVSVLTGDDFQQRYKSGESEQDSLTTQVISTMTEDIEEELDELDEPVAVEQSDLEELQEKADQFEEMTSSLKDLRERTEVLDDVDREQVEELAESEEPVVLESARHEQLQDEAEQVKGVYASSLAEAYDVFDAEELTDKFSIEELREKFEENIGDPEEELAADPKSGDPDEEELEEAAEEEEESEELSDEEKEAEKKRAELREKITSGGR